MCTLVQPNCLLPTLTVLLALACHRLEDKAAWIITPRRKKYICKALAQPPLALPSRNLNLKRFSKSRIGKSSKHPHRCISPATAGSSATKWPAPSPLGSILRSVWSHVTTSHVDFLSPEFLMAFTVCLCGDSVFFSGSTSCGDKALYPQSAQATAAQLGMTAERRLGDVGLQAAEHQEGWASGSRSLTHPRRDCALLSFLFRFLFAAMLLSTAPRSPHSARSHLIFLVFFLLLENRFSSFYCLEQSCYALP